MRLLALTTTIVIGLGISAAAAADPIPSVILVQIFARSEPVTAHVRALGADELELNGEDVVEPVRLRAGAGIVQWTAGKKKGSSKNIRLIPKSGGFAVYPGNNAKARRYRGALLIRSVKKKLELINEAPLEEYVTAVLSSEAPDMIELAALDAMAITIRSYAVAARSRHPGKPYQLCDLQHCQVYRGTTEIREAHGAASVNTQGRLITFDGHPVAAYYHACCGGRTESFEEAWNQKPVSYLVSVEDTFGTFETALCSHSRSFTWSTRFSGPDIGEMARSKKWLRKNEWLKDVQISSRSVSGRVKKVRFVTTQRKNVEISGSMFLLELGRRFGWKRLKSTWFDVERSKNGKSYAFTGHGYGHGVGFCQAGAEGMARLGASAEQILSHYYPGTHMSLLGEAVSSDAELESLPLETEDPGAPTDPGPPADLPIEGTTPADPGPNAHP